MLCGILNQTQVTNSYNAFGQLFWFSGRNPPKWQKNDLVSWGHGRAAKLGACVNWVEWLRTSADTRMWSGLRAVVMVQ